MPRRPWNLAGERTVRVAAVAGEARSQVLYTPAGRALAHPGLVVGPTEDLQIDCRAMVMSRRSGMACTGDGIHLVGREKDISMYVCLRMPETDPLYYVYN